MPWFWLLNVNSFGLRFANIFIDVFLNLFHAIGLCLCPLKTENLWFSDVFKGYSKRPVEWHGWRCSPILILLELGFNGQRCISEVHWKMIVLSSFVPSAPFLYHLKTSEDFLMFPGGREGCIWSKWVKMSKFFEYIVERFHFKSIYFKNQLLCSKPMKISSIFCRTWAIIMKLLLAI